MIGRSQATILSAVVFAAVTGGLGPHAGYGEPNTPGIAVMAAPSPPEVFHTVQIEGRKWVRLRSGRKYPVLPLMPQPEPTVRKDGDARRIRQRVWGNDRGGVSALATPDSVDHRSLYGPLRDQGDRGTCSAFATAAAVEGCYRHLDPRKYRDLDLSEQWVHHITNMAELRATPASAAYRENQMAGWAGARPYYQLLALQLYGVPTEAALGYNPDAAVESIGDENDPKLPQWTVDNYNLDADHLPLSTLGAAPYRPTGVALVAPDALAHPAEMEALLAAGHDVVALMDVVSPMYQNGVDAWTAGTDSEVAFAHVVLIVGYNRQGRYYVARNCWGGDGVDGGYTRISYEYLTEYGTYGCYVTGVADPEKEGTQGRQYLGRWEIAQWKGVLDIYRLPGLYALSPYDLNQKDYRIGTYYENGSVWRVNGYWGDGELLFCIDFGRPNTSRDTLFGNWFSATVFSFKDDTLFGFAQRDGWQEFFLGARKMQTY